MKLLFLYRYGVLGGVCTQLYHRFRNMNLDNEFEIHCGFRSDHGVADMLSPYATLHFGLNESTAETLLNKEQFDVVIIIDSEEYIKAVRNSNHSGQVFVEVHTSIEANLEYLSRLNNSDLDAFIVVSRYIMQRVNHYISKELIGKRVIIVPNVIDSGLFKQISYDPNGPSVIAWVGKIDDHKDWRTFMKIAQKINHSDDNIEFWMAGGQTCSEEKAQEVLDLADELGIVSRLRWFDRIENHKMANFYSLVAARGGICLVTSHCESFGMAILESLFSGCPVVSTDVGAIPEIKHMGDWLKLYSLHDLDTATNLCLNSINDSREIRQNFTEKRVILNQRYSSESHSVHYLQLLDAFHLSESQEHLSNKLKQLQLDSFIKIEHTYNREMLMKPKSYIAPILDLNRIDKNSKIKVGCIMDEFSYSSYSGVFDLLNISLDNWKTELVEHKPVFFFLESAWKGKDWEWEHKINRMEDELLLVLKWCRENRVPIIFWNKEDPVHFNTFLSTANQCDYVFTTDIDVIRDYQNILQHDRVFLLPFAANQIITNPISKFERKTGASFAGAYYLKYHERAENLSAMMSGLSKIMPLEIYDRFYHTSDPRYSFPKKFEKYIVGTLAYDEIDIAYKGYEYGVNMNSVKQSQTMFARRVFELMASNTVVLSNYSRAMRMQFGDLIVCSDDKTEISKRIDADFQDGLTLDKKKLIALRKTLTTNTYLQRSRHIIEKISNSKNAMFSYPKVLIICEVDSDIDLQLARKNFERQMYSNKKVIFVHKHKYLDEDLIDEIHIHRTVTELQSTLRNELRQIDYVSIMNSNDYYAENYLVDLISATAYSNSEIITKNQYYSFIEGEVQLIKSEDNKDYQYAEQFHLDCTIFKMNKTLLPIFESLNFGKLFDEIQTKPIIFGADRFNYCKGLSEESSLQDLSSFDSEVPKINSGIEMSEYLKLPEVGNQVKNSRKDVKVLDSKWFYLNINIPNESEIQLQMRENNLIVKSKLSNGSHKYFYSKETKKLDELFGEDPGIFFEKSPGLNVMFVIQYLNEQKDRIGNQVLSANTNHILEIPNDSKYVQFGIRVLSSGVCEIGDLNLQLKDLAPEKIFTSNKNLLISNNYPSYSNLYRNQFLHSRIEGYISNGVEFDVFILNSDSAINYYEYHNVDVITGSTSALENLLESNKYDAIFVHFLNEEMWSIVKNVLPSQKLCIWAHGAEIQPYERRIFNYSSNKDRSIAKELSKTRMKFWKGVFRTLKANMKMIFVSKYFSEEVFEDLQIKLKPNQYRVIHNPIDVKRFEYKPKIMEKRKKILSIRTFATRKYANDITVNAILELSKHAEFKDMDILIAGDGVLFDEVTKPLEKFTNVSLKKGFLTHKEYEDIFDEYGIFLIPTRWDSQGVSRDEAMAAGLVPATNRISAIPEFADDSCAILADPEDHIGLANGILNIYKNPDLFSEMSNNASKRVRIQTAAEITISKELELIRGPKNE